MSDIQSLNSDAQRLADKVDFWNRWNIAFITLAFLAAAGLVVTSFALRSRNARLASAQERLIKTKDSLASLEISKANLLAGQANERAGKSEREAAKLTEANLRLEATVAPRRLSDSQQKSLEKLTEFAGKVVEIKSYSGDTEGAILATQILDALQRSGLQIVDNRLTVQPSGSIIFGVSINGPNAALTENMQRILSKDNDLLTKGGIVIRQSMGIAFIVTRPPSPPAAIILVGTKPIK
ncbi:MAG: hypothetical protein ACYDCM_07230 [Candidatus Acidiferrales bacterium]